MANSTLEMIVSTHSRAEAAALYGIFCISGAISFNTQPRGGGCPGFSFLVMAAYMFQHTAARRRLHKIAHELMREEEFQHTAARRRLQVYYK